MYQGRHCTYNDYQLLENISAEFLLIINRDNFNNYEVEMHLDTFSDFDIDISNKIRTNLEKLDLDKEVVINKIANLLNELKSNVLVDIREHN